MRPTEPDGEGVVMTEDGRPMTILDFVYRAAADLGLCDAALGVRTTLREAVIQVLSVRGVPLTEADRTRVLLEEDPARLRRRHARAVLAATAADVFTEA